MAMDPTNISSGSIDDSVTDMEEDFEIGLAWMPVISLPILMLFALSAFGCILVILSSVQVMRERRNDVGKAMNFNEGDEEEAVYKPKTSSSSQSEYLKIDPSHPHIDPKLQSQPVTMYAKVELFCASDACESYPSSPPSAGTMPRRGNRSGNRKNTNTNRASTQYLPPSLPQNHNQLQPTQAQPQVEGSPSKSRRPSDADPEVAARESSSSPMVMNGLWKRIERLLKMGFDADTNSCQLSFVHHNNNSALRPSCSDSASLPVKRPMVFRTDCNPNLIESSNVQLQSTSSQTETSSSTFPRKIVCRCCLDRHTGLPGKDKDPLQRSSSSSLLKNIYLKNNLRALTWSNISSDLTSETSNPGRPRLAIHEDDISNKLCLSVDEKIRRYRLCYSSSSDDDSDV